MDPRSPSAEATAIQGDRILAVGSNRAISRLVTHGTKVIDLRGATVLPGFIDCHIHLVEYGLSLQNLDLRDAPSIEDLKQRVSTKAKDAPLWVLGRGWDQEKFAEHRYPTRWDLDEASPDKPVLLRRVCGHICVVNSIALEKANITAATPDPMSGIIDRTDTGEPTGILRENAMELVDQVVPDPSSKEYETAVLVAGEKALQAGLTSVHCIVGSPMELKALLKLRSKGRLPLRIYVFFTPDQMRDTIRVGLRSGFGDEWVRLGGVKIFTDGSLGARTAGLQDPYSDDPSNRGVITCTQKELDDLVSEAHQANLQTAIHAIGDRAIEMALNSVRKAKSQMPGGDMRHRIEHASVLNPELIQRLKELELIASVQPHFVVSDFWVPQRLGEKRTRFTYPFSSLVRTGVLTVGGSDCPVEPLTPLSGISAAVNRSDVTEALSVHEAISLYTRNAAFASFEEKVKGTIEPGKYADLAVLEKDPAKVETSKIAEIGVIMTIIGGRVVYSSAHTIERKQKKQGARRPSSLVQ